MTKEPETMDSLRDQIIPVLRELYGQGRTAGWGTRADLVENAADAILKLIEPRGEGELREALEPLFSRWDEYEAEKALIFRCPKPGGHERLQRNSSKLCREIRPLMASALAAATRATHPSDEGGRDA